MKRNLRMYGLILVATIAAVFTFRFPDWDIRLLGIGKHRYFLFHSSIVPLLALWGARKLRDVSMVGFLATSFVVGFLVGVGVHLVTDVFQTKAVMFPFIGSLVDGTSVDDRLWEGGNALVCFGSAWRSGRKQIRGSATTSFFE